VVDGEKPGVDSRDEEKHTGRNDLFAGSTWFLGLIRVHTPNVTSIGLAVVVGLTVVTNRQTDRLT